MSEDEGEREGVGRNLIGAGYKEKDRKKERGKNKDGEGRGK